MLDPIFREAMTVEVTALEEQGTWDVVNLPRGKKALAVRGKTHT